MTTSKKKKEAKKSYKCTFLSDHVFFGKEYKKGDTIEITPEQRERIKERKTVEIK